MTYTDNDITFYLVVYKDYDRACWCLNRLRRHYPLARVVIDVDGDADRRWMSLRKQFDVELRYGKRLFLLKYGGALVSRMLQHHATDPQNRRWFFRIDTDTDIRRRFAYLPPHDYFGHYYPWRNFVQGGCVGMTRNVCDRILHSRCLENPEIATKPIIWQERKETASGRVGRYGLVSLDWVLNWAMQQIGVVGKDFAEVRSTWKTPIPDDVDCAVAHPCKHIKVYRPI